ncbi:MAG: outer membrane beta-barrel protein, partial [Candidatus Latescibacteria bacterium]|nr:outer membrane beta-barrel protein [Candidatus Latescibacterota bacterium]
GPTMRGRSGEPLLHSDPHMNRQATRRKYLLVCAVLLFGFVSQTLAAWGVYTSSFVDVGPSQREVEQIKRFGLDATHVQAQVGTRTFYRVRAAVVATRQEAVDVRGRLREAGYDSWIKQVPDTELRVQAIDDTPTTSAPSPDTTVAPPKADSLLRASQLDSMMLLIGNRIDRAMVESEERLEHEMAERLADQHAMNRTLFVPQADQDQLTDALLERTDRRASAALDSMRNEWAARVAGSVPKPVVGGFLQAWARYDSEAKHSEFAVPEAQIEVRFEAKTVVGRIEVEIRETPGAAKISIQQAFGTWRPDWRGHPTATAGTYLSPLGLDHPDLVSRPFLSTSLVSIYATPTSLTGIHIGARTGHIEGQVFAANGWDILQDNNDLPTAGVRISWLPSDSSHIAVAVVAGPEQAGNTDNLRTSVGFEAVATWSKIIIAGELAYGQEDDAPQADRRSGFSSWIGGQAYLIWRFANYASVGFRGEVFQDKDSTRTGRAVDPMWSAALAPRIHVGPNLDLVGEYHLDRERAGAVTSWSTRHTVTLAVTQRF